MDKETKKQLKEMGFNKAQIKVLEGVQATFFEAAGLSLGVDLETDQVTIEPN